MAHLEAKTHTHTHTSNSHQDRMTDSHHYYHRINANLAEPFTEAQVDDFDPDPDNECSHIRSLLTHSRLALHGKWDHGDENLYLESRMYTFWCDDGELRELTVFTCKNGLANLPLPNHRANALIDAGRFTSKDRVEFKDGRNQSFKEHNGCNFALGDLVCKIPVGAAGPDHSVYKNNPIWYVMQPREPTAEMVTACGKELARNKLVPTRKMDVLASVMTPRNPVWEDTTYCLAPENCTNYEFKILLKLWGVQQQALDRLFEHVEEPPQYATHLQYTREWAALEPADRVLIWSLPQTPSGPDGIGWTDCGARVPLSIMFKTVFGNLRETPERLEFLQVMKNWEAPPEKRRDLLFVDFAFGRHHSSRGVVRNVPMPREAFLAMTQSEDGTETLQLVSTRAETKRIGSAMMKVVAKMLDSTPQPAKCESCGRSATDMKGFVCFQPSRNKDGGRFIASDEWFHCKSISCQDQAEFNAKRGDEREEASELRAGDESAMFLVPGNNSEVSDNIMSLIDVANSQIGPGAAIATNLGNGKNTVRVDYTEAVFKFESIAEQIKLRVPYKKLTSVDPHLKFPGYWSLERARAAGFIGNEVSDETRHECIREMFNSAVAKVFEEHKLTCSVCLIAAPTGFAFQVTYIPTLDGTKGTFVPSSKERWVCESQRCLAKAGKGLQRDKKKMGFRDICSNCGKNDEKNQRCARCRKVCYCSRECQVAHWAHHKVMCNSIKKLNSKREKEKRRGTS